MKTITINKELIFNEGYFTINYEGIPNNENFDLNKVQVLLDDFLNNHSHKNMIENVTIVKTILKDCDEKILVICYKDRNSSETVKYLNSNFYLYEIVKKGPSNDYTIKYDLNNGINFDYSNSEIDLVSDDIKEIVDQIHRLKNIEPVFLNPYDKAIVEMYRLFYNENPNFSSKDINNKVQSMLFLLKEFGISLSDDYEFISFGKGKMPISLRLKQAINKLYPFDKIDNPLNDIKLTDKCKKTIKIIGDCIREELSKEQDLYEALIIINKYIYASKYIFPDNWSRRNLKKYTKCTDNEILSCIKLVNNLENKVNKKVI